MRGDDPTEGCGNDRWLQMEDAAWAELHCCPESLISWSYAGCVQATGAGTKSLAGWRAGMQLGNLDIPICSSEARLHWQREPHG